jgi:4-amino-4-deoxy-L-arabinose transferase-like glycosyltransferase
VVLAVAVLFWIAYRLASRHRFHAAALAIALAALLIRAYAGADLALHPWDERYHALVSKNLIANPLVPTLRADPVLDYDFRNWASNHVWLHKPPLALWMQAASMRLFGVSEWPLRVPSLLFSTGAVLATYGVGSALLSPPAGLLAAAFHAVHGFSVDLAAGRRATDHVDTLLIFLVDTGFLLAILAARTRPRASGIVLGAAVGLAYLTKSFLGLLMLPIWAAMRLQTDRAGRVATELGIAVCVGAAISAPWTMYTMRAFPLESAYERAAALRHVTEVMENQGGPPWLYLWEMPRFFGELVWIPLGAAALLVMKGRGTPAYRALLLWVAIPYALFSMCATKMPAYVMVAAPAIFLLQADFWLRLHERHAAAVHRGRRAVLAACLFVLALLPARYLLGPTGPLEHRERNPEWVRQLRALNQQIGSRRAVIFNVPAHIEAMFYTPYVVYDFPATALQADDLRRRGYDVYVFADGAATPFRANAE